jgi:hypothetical protein
MEPMLWPASLVVIALCGGIFYVLRQRERQAKLREILADDE